MESWDGEARIDCVMIHACLFSFEMFSVWEEFLVVWLCSSLGIALSSLPSTIPGAQPVLHSPSCANGTSVGGWAGGNTNGKS